MLKEVTIPRRFVTVLLIFISGKRSGSINFFQDRTDNLPNRHAVKAFIINALPKGIYGRSPHAEGDRPERQTHKHLITNGLIGSALGRLLVPPRPYFIQIPSEHADKSYSGPYDSADDYHRRAQPDSHESSPVRPRGSVPAAFRNSFINKSDKCESCYIGKTEYAPENLCVQCHIRKHSVTSP